jgi:hypothetical protein
MDMRIHRRKFIASSPLILLGARYLEAAVTSHQSTPRGLDLRDELSPGEIEIVRHSSMAANIPKFFTQGYSCAETGLAVGLRYLEKPDDFVWAAAGFGGGLHNGDLCGFLTGGAMALGLYAGSLGGDRRAAKKICGEKIEEFWNWWTSTAPLHCAEIREARRDFKVCHRLGRLSAAKVESLMA